MNIIFFNRIQLRATLLVVISLFFQFNICFGLDDAHSGSLTFPLRGAFYYSWYPQTWTVGGEHVSYKVELGYYSSDDPDVVDQHIQDMDYAKIDVAIASWWGIDKHNQANRFPMLLDQTIAAGSSLKWAIYYEKEGFGNPTVEELKTDLDYLMETYAGHEAFARIDGKPVVFVYNADDNNCEVAERWAQAANGEWYVNLKVFGGFRNCPNQPDSWHQYGPASAAQQHGGYSYAISPGFWRADEASPRLERDVDRWNKNVRDMTASGEPWQLITTFNEWGEGTAIERCWDWSSDTEYGLYLDALHNDGKPIESAVNEESATTPGTFELAQNYPNPFNPTTQIEFSIPDPSMVRLAVFNIAGKEVITLIHENKTAGTHAVAFDGSEMTSGVYFYRLEVGDKIFVNKLTLMK